MLSFFLFIGKYLIIVAGFGLLYYQYTTSANDVEFIKNSAVTAFVLAIVIVINVVVFFLKLHKKNEKDALQSFKPRG